jgi:hypothetical protein
MIASLITHRGIDVPLGTLADDIVGESTWEAFSAQIGAGFGLEFDIQPMLDGNFAISHDTNLNRISGGELNLSLSEIGQRELQSIKLPGGRLCDLDELLCLLVGHSSAVSALHLKWHCQNRKVLDLLVARLSPFLDKLSEQLIIFDAAPWAAQYLKTILPNIELAASVAHSFDIQRYGSVTGGTLLTVNELTKLRELYSWAWLDEWDRVGPRGTQKSIVNPAQIGCLRKYGFKIAAVSPELHATSPELIGWRNS